MNRSTPPLMNFFRILIYAHTEISETWVCWRVFLFMIVRLFHSSSRLFLLQILMWYFETILSVLTYSNKPAPKRLFLNIKRHFNGQCSKVQGTLKMLVPHLNLGHRQKEVSTARKFLLSPVLIKQSSFYVKNSKFEMPIKENVFRWG